MLNETVLKEQHRTYVYLDIKHT